MIVLSQLGPPLETAVKERFDDVAVTAIPYGERAPDGVRGDVLVVLPTATREAPVLTQLDDLGVQWVHLASTGIDAYPLDLLRGRVVTCNRGVSGVPIAEFTLAAMLAFEKRLPDVWAREPPEHWAWAELGTLDGRTLGLVGLGGIGVEVARRALAFGMRVVAVRRTAQPSPLPGVEVVPSLDEVLREADHLVVTAPATAATRHLLDASAFAMVKPGLHLVNISRGSLVDQDALRVALDDGRVAMASLDVAEPEPVPAGHWLYEHPRVRLSPHLSWSSPRLLEGSTEYFVANLARYKAGQPLAGLVDVDEEY